MTSSDSGEDFESADEDFGFDQPAKQIKSELVDTNSKTEKENDLENKTFPNENSNTTERLQHFLDLKLEDNSGESKDYLSNALEDVKIKKSTLHPEEPSAITNLPSFISESLDSNSPVELEVHIQTPNLTEDFLTVNAENEIENSKIPSNICQISETNKEIPTDLKNETKPDENLQFADGWEVDEDEDILCEEEPTVENNQLRRSETWQVEEGDFNSMGSHKYSDDIEIKPKDDYVIRQGCPLRTEKPLLQDGLENDGLEIEEEDGFEIPISLAKTSDGSIKCAQEQICELDRVEFEPKKHQQEDGWGVWGGWGVGSLLSTASTHVTAGLSSVLETAVGAPNPETLASALQQNEISESPVDPESNNSQEKQTIEEHNSQSSSFGGFGSLVSGVSFLGSSVINRGLDTLETLGKKTMEVLQEGDPGLKKKRAMLFADQDKPILSQILREAKEKADNSDKEKEEKETARKVHFESLFDDYQGMVHLEALEMLSTQCDLKLQSLMLSQSGPQLEDLQETLSQVRDLCELADDDEESEVLTKDQFIEKVTKCVKDLNIMITPAKIIKVNDEVMSRLGQLSCKSAAVVNQTAISSLAEFTAAAMECFHKSAELLLAKQIRNTPEEAESYVQLTSHLCARASAIANEFTQLLTQNHPIANSSIITNIFLEASNSCSYIRNACQLLVPILQVGTIST